MNNNEFEKLGINNELIRLLVKQGYEQPTPIQQQTIPHLLDQSDLLGIAQTGTGKTAAFVLPLIQNLLATGISSESRCPRVLILAPTRELAAQITEEVRRFSQGLNLSHACIFGGVGARPQIKALNRGVDVLVATPGRLLDLAGDRYVDLSRVEHLVLDEADRLLDMGFIRDVRRIIKQTPSTRQSLLFSATMPREVARLADEILNRPVRVDVSPKQVTVKEIEQGVINVRTEDKQRMLEQLLRDDAVTRAIVFTRTKHGANKVAKKLGQAGICAEAIHGNKTQNARQRALESFKNGDAWVLVATDIAARGIDINAVSHVVNFELPHEPESYVHRIGRTARAGATGVAWSLVDPSEVKRLRAVERLTRHKPVEIEVDLPARSHSEQQQPRTTQTGGDRQARQNSTANGDRNRNRSRRSRKNRRAA